MEKEMEKESKDLMMPTVSLLAKFPPIQNPESETDDERFKQSLKELKNLSSQLYHAADYCENAFLKTTQKKILLKNTKNYVCEVLVTVVDHLGTLSSNLEQRIYSSNKLSQTEQRIDCLKQRLFTGQQYAFTLDLSSLAWSTKFPRHHRRYISPLAENLEKSNGVSRAEATDSNVAETSCCEKDQFTEAAGDPTFDAKTIMKPAVTNLTSGTGLATVLPVSGGPSRFLTPFNPSFGSPAQDTFKLGSSDTKKTPLQGSYFLSFLRKSKRKK